MSTDLLLGLLAFHSSQVLFKKHSTLVLVYSDQSVSIFTFPKLNPGFFKILGGFFFPNSLNTKGKIPPWFLPFNNFSTLPRTISPNSLEPFLGHPVMSCHLSKDRSIFKLDSFSPQWSLGQLYYWQYNYALSKQQKKSFLVS